MKNRRGFIRISESIFRNIDDNAEVLSLLFSKFIPIRIEPDFDGTIYRGYSEFFDEVKEGEMIPQYDVIITKHDDGGIIEFKRFSFSGSITATGKIESE